MNLCQILAQGITQRMPRRLRGSLRRRGRSRWLGHRLRRRTPCGRGSRRRCLLHWLWRIHRLRWCGSWARIHRWRRDIATAITISRRRIYLLRGRGGLSWSALDGSVRVGYRNCVCRGGVGIERGLLIGVGRARCRGRDCLRYCPRIQSWRAGVRRVAEQPFRAIIVIPTPALRANHPPAPMRVLKPKLF